jgi:hypothetical protein
LGGIEDHLNDVLEDHGLGDFSWVTVEQFIEISRTYLNSDGYVERVKNGYYQNPVTGAVVRILKADMDGHGKHPPHGHLEAYGGRVNIHLLLSDSQSHPRSELRKIVYDSLDDMMGYHRH